MVKIPRSLSHQVAARDEAKGETEEMAGLQWLGRGAARREDKEVLFMLGLEGWTESKGFK